MLVLARHIGETVNIGNDIAVTVLRIGKDGVRLGFTAPRDVAIVRSDAVVRVPQLTIIDGEADDCREFVQQ